MLDDDDDIVLWYEVNKKVKLFPLRGRSSDMGDKCRRYVADPNIGCFQASRCGAIAYRGKMF